MSQAQKNIRGIFAIILAMAFFVANDTLVKLAREHWGTGQTLVIRGIFALVMLAIWIVATRQMHALRHIYGKLVILRAVLECLVAMLFIAALGMMGLAEITAILMLAPLVITALSIVFFHEQVGWRRWLAILVGFAGMLLVVQPGSGATPLLATGMALLSTLLVACRDIVTRKLPEGTSSIIVTLATTIGTTLGGAALVAVGDGWKPIFLSPILTLAGAALFVLVGNYAVIEAYRGTELSVVSPFRYSVIVWAVVLAILVFGDWPSVLSLIGIALIGLSGVYTLHRERVRRREALETQNPSIST